MFNNKIDVIMWLNKMGIENYIVNDNLTVDVDGDINLFKRELKSIPVQFNIVNGDFNCAANQLESLQGCPKFVYGDFYCYKNKIKSLTMAPEEVCGGFDCGSNNLTSLKGCPKIIKADFNCSDNNLFSLNNGPEEVGGNYSCYYNKLTSLEGVPKIITGTLHCAHNFLTYFKFFPDVVNRINLFNNKINHEELVNFNTNVLEKDIRSDFGNYEQFIEKVRFLKTTEIESWLLNQTCSSNEDRKSFRRKI